MRKSRTNISSLHVHLILVTKYRRSLLTEKIFESLEYYAKRALVDKGVTIEECNGDLSHVHFLLEYPTTESVSSIVQAIKGPTSRKLRALYPNLRKHKALWSPSYYVTSSGGVTLSILKDYINNQ